MESANNERLLTDFDGAKQVDESASPTVVLKKPTNLIKLHTEASAMMTRASNMTMSVNQEQTSITGGSKHAPIKRLQSKAELLIENSNFHQLRKYEKQ